jgi:hypothetical protein
VFGLTLVMDLVMDPVMALVKALVLGVATTAMSATGGNFVLGKGTRRAKAQSLLTANAAAPALTLANNGTQAATAINPKGASGKAPMTVNESAGTATNLSADEPDGKSGGDFYVAGGKVADASRPHAGEDMRALAWTPPWRATVRLWGLGPGHGRRGMAAEKRAGVRAILGRAIEELGWQERVVTTFSHYYEGLTLRELGGILGLMDGRISQTDPPGSHDPAHGLPRGRRVPPRRGARRPVAHDCSTRSGVKRR